MTTLVARGALVFVCLPLVLGACGDNQDEAGARALLADVRAQGYRAWERAPGFPARAVSNAPHGDEVDIYVNVVIADALAAAEPLGAWPLGSIVVKDGWDDSELVRIAVMQKRSEGWFWAEYDGQGDPSYSGHPELCTDCHRRGSDFVRAFSLP